MGDAMTRPWPDEVRSVADALMRECADPCVVAGSNGTSWVVYAAGGSAEYDATVMLWRRGGTLITKTEALELLQRSSTAAPAKSLADRICEAVPTARVSATSDGIEVTVGSKSVRWKREQRGWSWEDDLFCSDERVIERTKLMAAEDAPAAPQPSPQAQALLDALRAQGYEPTYKRGNVFEEYVTCEGESAGRGDDDALWTYLGGQAGTEYVAEQMGLRIARRRERKTEQAPTLTVNCKILDTDALAATLARASNETLNQVKQAHATKGAQTMTTLDQAKVDASEAALRTAAKQLAKAARDPLAGAVARHLAPGDDGMRAKVAALLETEAGLAMLKALLSLALDAIPQAGTRGAALAHELRVQAMADGADLALDLVMGPLREVVALYLQDPGGVAAPALDAPQAKSVEWMTAGEKEGAR